LPGFYKPSGFEVAEMAPGSLGSLWVEGWDGEDRGLQAGM